MRLSELLTAERIQTSLAVSSKAAVLDALAALLARGTDGVRPDEVARVLREREALASTGVGDEVAIPHGKLPGLKQLVGALALSREGIEFDAIDGKPVKIFVAILAPAGSASDHLRALARCSKLLRDARVRDELILAESSARAFEIVQRESMAL